VCGGPDRRGIRKPLVVFTPKSLLRHHKAVSTLSDLTSGAFQEVISDTTVVGSGTRRILLCSGKVYYDLLAKREESSQNHIAIIRLEQLYPFPMQRLTDILRRYSDAAEIYWVQEEPENMGAWYFVERQLQDLIKGRSRTLKYVGRPTAASPGAGAHKVHSEQQRQIVEDAFATAPVVRKAKRLVRKTKQG
jgi:2-oxoglutarate dehydrogenase complex dehydrogenase (E1) component-like enzyme